MRASEKTVPKSVLFDKRVIYVSLVFSFHRDGTNFVFIGSKFYIFHDFLDLPTLTQSIVKQTADAANKEPL